MVTHSFRRPAIIARFSKVFEVTGYGVASVFTPASKRGHGYASHMMRLLHWVLAPRSVLPTEFPAGWGSPPNPVDGYGGDAQFSVLYSDIGRTFYRNCGPDGGQSGWLERGSIATVFEVGSVQPLQTGLHDTRWTLLKEDDVKSLYDHEPPRMKAELMEPRNEMTEEEERFNMMNTLNS